jgi:nephrocystin-3
MTNRVIRVFLSSTFRDFGEERDLLVRKVFPTLRAKLQSRFVDLVDVDLRWGITEEEAERGEVLPICLSEIDRARPYFIGFLGERYGWVPPPDAYPSNVLESQPWLEEHRGGKSVTELEILHGVLNNPHMEGRALFYFRSFEYSSSKGGDYIASSPTDEVSQSILKETIRQSGFPVYEDYKSPEHLAEILEQDLWEILDREFPASDIPDAFVRENLQHEAYSLPRQRLYIGGDLYLAALDKALSEDNQWILVDGPSGGGKSALLANWLKYVSDRERDTEVHAHYLGATADATDSAFLVRRLIECIKRKTESTDDIASDPDELFDSLPTWLANASSWCELRDKKFLFVIDALNGLSDRRDLRWFPRMLPKHIHLVISTLPGEVNDALQEKADWSHVSVMPLDATTAELVFTSYLALFNKTLPDELVKQVMAHKLSVNPLFLLTLAEELRLFGEHEQLSNRLDHYLTSITVDDLFERVLERIEQDYGADTLREIMTALWAARAGLREEEILGYCSLKPMHWAYIRNALGPTLIDASGRLIFAHDYMRIAVSDRYMAGNNKIGNEGQSEEALNLRHAAHKKLVRWFEEYAFQDGQSILSDKRAAEEIPYQWQQAKDWKKLQTALTKQKMLVAILKHRSEQELLSYWLTLEANITTDIETQYEKAWKKWKLNENKETTGDIAQKLAEFIDFSGRFLNFAERLFKLNLEIQMKIHGISSLEVAKCNSSIGLHLLNKGNYEIAKEYLLQSYVSKDVKLGIHNDTLIDVAALGIVYGQTNMPSSAEPMFLKDIEDTKILHGEQSVEFATACNNIGVFFRTEGRFEEAESYLQSALAIRMLKFGRTDLKVANTLSNLGVLKSRIADYAAADAFHTNALEMSINFLGKDHPETLIKIINKAANLKRQKKYSNAKSLYQQILSTAENIKAVPFKIIDTAANNYINLLDLLEEPHVKVGVYETLIKFISQNYEPNVRALSRNLLFLAQTFDEIAEYEKSEDIYLTLLHDKKFLTETDEPVVLYTLAQNLRLQKKYSTAEDYYRLTLAIEERDLGTDHADIAITYYNLGITLAEQAKYLDAEDYFQKTLKIELRELGEDDPDIALTLLWLGESQFHQAKFDDAEQNLLKALSLQIAQYSERHIKLKRVLELLRDVSVALGKDTDAQSFAEKIISLEK